MKDSRFSAPSMLGRDLDGVSGVYALIDPRTSQVMYVGQSLNIGLRYRSHCTPNHWENNFPRMAWINELSRLGLVPSVQVIRECGYPEMNEIEQAAIKRFREIGQCELNIALGGKHRGQSRKGKVTREDWIQLGRKLRLALDLLSEIHHDIYHILGTKTGDRFTAFRRKASDIREDLACALADAHPDWPEGRTVFHGKPGEPANAPNP